MNYSNRKKIVEILNNNGSNELEYKLLSRDVPRSLYKYCDINEYTIRALKNNLIYPCSPLLFNDAFDSRLHIDTYSKKICKYDYLEKIGVDADLNLNVLSENDRYIYDNFSDFMRIQCFSERYDSNLMWSHYGACHKGICIEYDFYKHQGKDFLEKFYPIIYSKEPIDVTNLCKDMGKIELAVLLSTIMKSDEWAYEKEWRLIFSFPGWNKLDDRIEVFAVKPTSIYLGSHFLQDIERDRMNESKIELLKEFVNYVELEEIPINMIIPKIGSYMLEAVPISIAEIHNLLRRIVL
ncbi:MAG: DUF2971 domain-containing protein [Clostridiales bacterium]|nr:DUF2971 domain-containing protein [Clostridiales bacterium]